MVCNSSQLSSFIPVEPLLFAPISPSLFLFLAQQKAVVCAFSVSLVCVASIACTTYLHAPPSSNYPNAPPISICFCLCTLVHECMYGGEQKATRGLFRHVSLLATLCCRPPLFVRHHPSFPAVQPMCVCWCGRLYVCVHVCVHLRSLAVCPFAYAPCTSRYGPREE